MLKKSGYGVLAEDEGPNFMLVTVDDCQSAFQEVLNGPEYEEDVIENINIRAISVQYNDFAKRISKYTGHSSD
eukprot:3075732-Karenia_brevis.AAC.1